MARRKLEIWTIDCETDPFKKGRDAPQPFIWGAYCLSLDRYETFGHASLLVDFLRTRRACAYAHNGGRFDYHYLREWFESEKPVLVINGRIAKFRIGACEFRDSFSILPVPLAAYQKEEIDYAIFEPEERDKPENRAKIEAYLKSDCVNLATLLFKFFEGFGRPLTIAGCAMAYYVKHYRNGVKPRQSAAQFEQFKPFYYGGRVECFAAGWQEDDFVIVDKNSAYPHAMLAEHPASSTSVWEDDLTETGCTMVALSGVSEGALPFRLENGELTFPRDRQEREYFVTGWEVQAALELGLLKISKVHRVHSFLETQNFRAMVTHFYAERRRAKDAGDKAGDLFNKLMPNSHYGKFASDPSKYHDYIIVQSDRIADMEVEGWKIWKPWGDGRWLCYMPIPEHRHWYYNIATAASITGYVRAQLLKDLNAASGLLYCDTDSIASRRVNKLTIGPQLGEWKLELECDAYAIAGKKMYAFRSAFDQQWNPEKRLYDYPKGEYKIACKGVDLDASDIIRVARGELVHYEPWVPTYSVLRPAPILIPRDVRLTARVQ